MGSELGFREAFCALTGNDPFPWQEALYEKFRVGDFETCRTCALPTGLGKTSIIALWLIALARHPDVVPRRLVYVVNRRTVVDQTTDEVTKYRKSLDAAGLRDDLMRLCAIELKCDDSPLAISTLRGQFADNREWSTDPARPAVICGTVDMIGSRLLFSGYNCGFKSRPLQAGFLGQDVLLVHDEAHLEPAFQMLLEKTVEEQNSGRFPEFDERRRLKVIELSATTRGTRDAFTLTETDLRNAIVRKRTTASKSIHLQPIDDERKLPDDLADLALNHRNSDLAVLIYARTVDAVEKIAARLEREKLNVTTLTGTMRGYERDELVRNPAFVRFLPELNRPEDMEPERGTVYLVCTSAGEVGVNISADHLVCDLTTFESMAQRFGRVNRFGERTDTRIDVVFPTAFDDDDSFDIARHRTLELIRRLDGVGSPQALSDIPAIERAAAFAPTPIIPPTSDILFDAWALTTITEKLPGRPPVEPYLHGLPTGWQPPETQFAWRREVEEFVDELRAEYRPAELLEDYPLKPHELLREPSYRAFKELEALAGRRPNDPAWLVDEGGRVELVTLIGLADKNRKGRIEGMTIVLPPSAGGLTKQGTLNGAVTPEGGPSELDVADRCYADKERTQPLRRRACWNDGEIEESIEQAARMRLIRRITLPPPTEDENAEPRWWEWYELRGEGSRTAPKPVLWNDHVCDVIHNAESIVAKLPLPDEINQAVVLAARWHDHGKKRSTFQVILGNRDYPNPDTLLAKSGGSGIRIAERYRHEFGSLLDVLCPERSEWAEFQRLSAVMQDLVLHLIAAHHGRARPHFPAGEDFDHEPPAGVTAESIAMEVPRRFARLQRKFGRWGLAYLESLLRAADWAASAEPTTVEKVQR